LPSDVVLSGADNMRTNFGAHSPLKFSITKNFFQIRRNLVQLSTLSANISETDRDIDKQ